MTNSDQFLHIVLNEFAKPAFLGTHISRTQVIDYLKISGQYDSLYDQCYYKLEGISKYDFERQQFNTKLERLSDEIEDRLKQLQEYIWGFSEEMMGYKEIYLIYDDISDPVFKYALDTLEYYNRKEELITLKKFKSQSIEALRNTFLKLGIDIITKDILKRAQERLTFEEYFTERDLWEAPISKLCDRLSEKLETQDTDPIVEAINERYYIKKYRGDEAKSYNRKLRKAVNSWRNNRTNKSK